ncbi:MAG: sigma-54-dependent Fis family transcriptional regulator [Myxococcales bacterium]|nr:sigma-54-dependent Fis family transcriptional regulator [Myxococcales bacterium]
MSSTSEIDFKRFPVLVVDDEPDNLSAFRFNFRRDFELTCAQSGAEALELLGDLEAAVIVTDQRMPGISGLELLERATELRPDAIGIVVSAYTDVDVLIDAVNSGKVHRYITKPWDAREVRAVLRQSIERYQLERENERLSEQLAQYAGYLDYQAHRAYDFGEIVGESAALGELLDSVAQVAPTNSTVLLLGETGTGKEMVARAIHLNSERAERPFVAINCAALPAELLESELFGHEKGAFTGATVRRRGRFELADGGTIFLDEVGDLPLRVQTKLLRVLQEREFQRVGGTDTIEVDVRVVSATNRDLAEMVEAETFRHDLYYRLNVFPLTLPPLRERGDDVLLLAEHFMRAFFAENRRGPRELSDAARAELRAYDWPGNVRELQNVIERACILAESGVLDADDLALRRRAETTPRPRGMRRSGDELAAATMAAGGAIDDDDDDARSLRERLHDQERSAIASAIEDSGGNIAAAARSLGINRSTLYFRIKKFDLEHLLPGRH